MFQRKKMRDVKPGDICRLKTNVRSEIINEDTGNYISKSIKIRKDCSDFSKKDIRAYHPENLKVLRDSVFGPSILVVQPFLKGNESSYCLSRGIKVKGNLSFLVSKNSLILS